MLWSRGFFYVLLALLLAACGEEERPPLRLAAVGPWHLPYGEASRRGIELALEEINREGESRDARSRSCSRTTAPAVCGR